MSKGEIFYLVADGEVVVEEGYFGTHAAAASRLSQMNSEVAKRHMESRMQEGGAPVEAYRIAFGIPLTYEIRSSHATSPVDKIADDLYVPRPFAPEWYATGGPIWLITNDDYSGDGYYGDEESAQLQADNYNGAKWELWTSSPEREDGVSFEQYAKDTYGGVIRVGRLVPHGTGDRADSGLELEVQY